MRNFSMSTMLGLFVALAGSASASPGTTTLNGHFTAVPSTPSIINVRDPFIINLLWDDAEPNQLGESPDYYAINVGTLSSFLIVGVPGFVDDVSVSRGIWTSHMRLDLTAVLSGVYIPMTVTIAGTGNTPGQILPDFTTISRSFVDLDLTPLAGYIAIEGPTQAVITSITNTFPPHDSDRDGVLDSVDNCWLMPNPDQFDQDDDGVGNACDNCTTVSNPGQADRDHDLIGDACDPFPDGTDNDDDGIPDAADNCPNVSNPDQSDRDNDHIGDACDPFPDDRDNEKAQLRVDLAAANQTIDDLTAQLDACLNHVEPLVCKADLTGDGVVNFADLAKMKSVFFQTCTP